MTYTDAPLSVNFKPGAGYDAPLLTIRSEDPVELAGRVSALEGTGLFLAISDADAKFKAAYQPSAGAAAATAVLGAQPVAVQPPALAPVAAAPVAATGGWGAPAAAAPVSAPAPAVYTPPAPAAANPAAAGAAPFIPAFGMAAKFQSGNSAKGAWSAWFDPRPKAQTDLIPADHTGKAPSTDNVDHPGLAAGTHKFAKFIR